MCIVSLQICILLSLSVETSLQCAHLTLCLLRLMTLPRDHRTLMLQERPSGRPCGYLLPLSVAEAVHAKLAISARCHQKEERE